MENRVQPTPTGLHSSGNVEQEDDEQGVYRKCLSWDLMVALAENEVRPPPPQSPPRSYIETPGPSPCPSYSETSDTPYPPEIDECAEHHHRPNGDAGPMYAPIYATDGPPQGHPQHYPQQYPCVFPVGYRDGSEAENAGHYRYYPQDVWRMGPQTRFRPPPNPQYFMNHQDHYYAGLRYPCPPMFMNGQFGYESPQYRFMQPQAFHHPPFFNRRVMNPEESVQYRTPHHYRTIYADHRPEQIVQDSEHLRRMYSEYRMPPYFGQHAQQNYHNSSEHVNAAPPFDYAYINHGHFQQQYAPQNHDEPDQDGQQCPDVESYNDGSTRNERVNSMTSQEQHALALDLTEQDAFNENIVQRAPRPLLGRHSIEPPRSTSPQYSPGKPYRHAMHHKLRRPMRGSGHIFRHREVQPRTKEQIEYLTDYRPTQRETDRPEAVRPERQREENRHSDAPARNSEQKNIQVSNYNESENPAFDSETALIEYSLTGIEHEGLKKLRPQEDEDDEVRHKLFPESRTLEDIDKQVANSLKPYESDEVGPYSAGSDELHEAYSTMRHVYQADEFCERQYATEFQYPLSEAHVDGSAGFQVYYPGEQYDICPQVFQPGLLQTEYPAGIQYYPESRSNTNDDAQGEYDFDFHKFHSSDTSYRSRSSYKGESDTEENRIEKVANKGQGNEDCSESTQNGPGNELHSTTPHRLYPMLSPVRLRPIMYDPYSAQYRDSMDEYFDYIHFRKRQFLDSLRDESYPRGTPDKSLDANAAPFVPANINAIQDANQIAHPRLISPEQMRRCCIGSRNPLALRRNIFGNENTFSSDSEGSLCPDRAVKNLPSRFGRPIIKVRPAHPSPPAEVDIRDVQCGSGDASSSSPISPHSPPSLSSAGGLYDTSPSSGMYQSSSSIIDTPHFPPNVPINVIISDELFFDTGDTKTCIGYNVQYPPPSHEVLSLIYNLGLGRHQRRRRPEPTAVAPRVPRPILGAGNRTPESPPRPPDYRRYPYAQVIALPWFNRPLPGCLRDVSYDYSARFSYTDRELDLMRAQGVGPRFCHTRGRNAAMYKFPREW